LFWTSSTTDMFVTFFKALLRHLKRYLKAVIFFEKSSSIFNIKWIFIILTQTSKLPAVLKCSVLKRDRQNFWKKIKWYSLERNVIHGYYTVSHFFPEKIIQFSFQNFADPVSEHWFFLLLIILKFMTDYFIGFNKLSTTVKYTTNNDNKNVEIIFISKIILTCLVEFWLQRPKESHDLIGQYTRVNVYRPIKSRDSLGLWRQRSTANVSIILDLIPLYLKTKIKKF
jgi:hypothetical protein